MSKNYCQNWKERLDFLIPQMVRQVSSSHKSADFVVERAYRLLYLDIIFVIAMSFGAQSNLIYSLLIIFSVLVIYYLNSCLRTRKVYLLGFKPSVVDIEAERVDGKLQSVKLGDSWLLDADTTDEEYYAWVVDALDSQLEYSKTSADKIAKSYNIANKISFMGIIIIGLLAFILSALGVS